MKRYGRLWERICSRENIEEAAENAVKGRKSRREQMRFLAERESNLDYIEDMLRNETYQFGPLKSITLTFGNVHIYENNIEKTRQLLNGDENVKFELNT